MASKVNRDKARKKYESRYGYAPANDSTLDSFINTLVSYELSAISDTSYADTSCYTDTSSSYTDTCSFDSSGW